MAQCLERSLAMLLVFVYGGQPDEITRSELDQILNSKFKKTMGQLIKELFPEKVEAFSDHDFQYILRKRNWLIHNYFYDRAGHFITKKGRELMLTELADIRDIFEQADNDIENICDEWRRKNGISDEDIENHLENILALQKCLTNCCS